MSHPADALPPDIVIHRDLAYGRDGHPRQTLDLYLPRAAQPLPLIVWIHGGAFRLGSKEDIAQQDPLALTYPAQGYALAAINYRLSQHARFPAQIEDCKEAVRWLRGRAAAFNLDPERFAAWGPSAGGHLAAMLGTTGQTPQFDAGAHLDCSSRVQCVVDFFGPTDFLQMDAQRLPEGQVHDAPDSPESRLVGGPIQANADKVAAANPITYVGPDAPPFLIIHGDRDPLVPYHQSTLLAAALEAAGVPVTFYTVPGGGHGGFADAQIATLVRAFLAAHLRAGQ